MSNRVMEQLHPLTIPTADELHPIQKDDRKAKRESIKNGFFENYFRMSFIQKYENGKWYTRPDYLTNEMILQHLEGKIKIGARSTKSSGLICVDIDNHEETFFGKQLLEQKSKLLIERVGITPQLIIESPRGIHFYWLFTTPARAHFRPLIKELNIELIQTPTKSGRLPYIKVTPPEELISLLNNMVPLSIKEIEHIAPPDYERKRIIKGKKIASSPNLKAGGTNDFILDRVPKFLILNYKPNDIAQLLYSELDSHNLVKQGETDYRTLLDRVHSLSKDFVVYEKKDSQGYFFKEETVRIILEKINEHMPSFLSSRKLPAVKQFLYNLIKYERYIREMKLEERENRNYYDNYFLHYTYRRKLTPLPNNLMRKWYSRAWGKRKAEKDASFTRGLFDLLEVLKRIGVIRREVKHYYDYSNKYKNHVNKWEVRERATRGRCAYYLVNLPITDEKQCIN